MAKLQRLNNFLTGRLMAAVDEVMEMVGVTLLEYEEETARIRRENEFLKQRLREIGFGGETEADSADPVTSVSTAGQQEWNSSLEQEPEPRVTQENQNQGLTEQPTSIKSEGLCYPAGPVSPESQNPTSAPTRAMFNPNCVKSERDENPVESEDHLGTYTVNKVIVDCDLSKELKTEPIVIIDLQSDDADMLPQTTDLESAGAANTYSNSQHITDLQSVNIRDAPSPGLVSG